MLLLRKWWEVKKLAAHLLLSMLYLYMPVLHCPATSPWPHWPHTCLLPWCGACACVVPLTSSSQISSPFMNASCLLHHGTTPHTRTRAALPSVFVATLPHPHLASPLPLHAHRLSLFKQLKHNKQSWVVDNNKLSAPLKPPPASTTWTWTTRWWALGRSRSSA